MSDDRDVIDITAPANSSNLEDLPPRLDTIRAIVRHRVPEATDDEIAEAYGTTEAEAGESVWLQATGLVIAALDELEERLDALEASLRPEEDDNDDDEPGDRRQA